MPFFRLNRLKSSVWLIVFLGFVSLGEIFADEPSDCQKGFSPPTSGERVSSSQTKKPEESSPQKLDSSTPAKNPADSQEKASLSNKDRIEGSESLALTPEEFMRHISEGAWLNRDQEIEFDFYLRKAFGEDLKGRGLNDVLEAIEPYPQGRLDKIPAREQKITFVLKQKDYPKSLKLFLESFRSSANKMRKMFPISNSWRLWAKKLSFEPSETNLLSDREAFFEYLDSSSFGQPIQRFLLRNDLFLGVTQAQTVREFVENPANNYRERILVLYKVLDEFRKKFIKERRKDQDISLTMVELIHSAGFGRKSWTDKLKSEDPEVVLEGVMKILLERDLIAKELNFNDWDTLKSDLLHKDQFTGRAKAIQKRWTEMELQLDKITKELAELSKTEKNLETETFRMRPLTLLESPFRGCLGLDCSTGAYFEKALDPAYIYFTLTDNHHISHGQITVILGSTKNLRGEIVKTAFVEQIQNIPNHRIVGMLEAIRLSLSEQGYLLALPKDLGKGDSVLSNELPTREFVRSQILPGLQNKLETFEPKQTNLPFEDSRHSRANLKLDLWEFELTPDQRDFEIHPGEIHSLKPMDKSFKVQDWSVKAMHSNKLEDQILFIINIAELVRFQLLTLQEALDYLQSKIKDKSLSFDLRKRAMFAVIHIQVSHSHIGHTLEDFRSRTNEILKKHRRVKSVKTALKDFELIESLLLEFSPVELKTLIGEMSNWKKSPTEYQKRFLLFLSYLFYPEGLSVVLDSPVPLLFESVADLSLKRESDEGDTALHRVAERGHNPSVQFLIDKGVDPNIRNDYEETPLHKAVEEGHIQVVQFLLDRGADPTMTDSDGESALHLAAQKGYIKIVEILLERGAELESQDNENKTPLHKAVEEGHISLVRLLDKWGADLSHEDNLSRTILHISAGLGHIEIVRFVLKKNKNIINKKTKHGETPFHYASLGRRKKIVQLLHRRGAELESQDNEGRTALHRVALIGHQEMVALLLNRGADPNSQENEGHTALHLAIWWGENLQIAELLLKGGADPNRKNNMGETPLHRVALVGGTQIIQLLHKWGADLDIQTKNGDTALHYATRKIYAKTGRLLYTWGADPTIKNNQGETPNELVKQQIGDWENYSLQESLERHEEEDFLDALEVLEELDKKNNPRWEPTSYRPANWD